MPPPPIPPRKPAHLSSSSIPPPVPGNKPKPATTTLLQTVAVKKRCLAWDWTSTRDNISMEPFLSPSSITGQENLICSVHNWNSWLPPGCEGKVPFRPMVRVEASLKGNDWAMAADNPHEIVHYLNEPERFNPSMSPAKAAEAWRKQMVPLRIQKSKKLVSPCVASDPAGTNWLCAFMDEVKSSHEMPDFLGLHYYSECADAAIAYLTEMHERWPQLPVIVPEIASISRDEKSVVEFTKALANWMDMTEWIYEYAFFGCMQGLADDFVSPAAQLMGKDGKPTRLGEMLMWECPVVGYL